ncbi:ATPase [Sorangium cellulosum]|uniref:ATPase n=1 Tax=Sorangium cellulosum TaxID=56 RepID=A0A4P2QCP8_SORCE|nr:SRPBCC family protein [Sorangium cellulosum]AUX27171.1 ATPase [Sorangium cellulosum]
MIEQPVHCSSFVLDRTYPYAPERVFSAWASAKAKARWFAGPEGWTELERVFEFRPGGRETAKGRFPDGKVSYFDARFHEIVPNRLLVYAYDMYVNDKKLSVSLASVEFLPEGTGTLLRMTEQGVFFGSKDDAPGREQGTVWLLDKLAAALSNPHVAH